MPAKGLPFTFAIRGNELFVSRKDKSIMRATVKVALRHISQLQIEGIHIDGPKKIGTFGASYLYPIFVMLGLITENRSCAMGNDIISVDTCISTEAVYHKKQKTSGWAIYMLRGKKKAEEKTRKPYLMHEVRLAVAEQTIERLTKLKRGARRADRQDGSEAGGAQERAGQERQDRG